MVSIAAQHLNALKQQAIQTWVPNWFTAFSDNEFGGFHERLDNANQSLNLPKRLVTQCRQIIVYSLASQEDGGSRYEGKLNEGFGFLYNNYFVPETGGSIFNVLPNGTSSDMKYDLYGHAFILLACAAYYNATKNPLALEYAASTLDFVDVHFRVEGQPGLINALDQNLRPIPDIRHQNPHMHLLEGCIYMAEASGDKRYLIFAREMIDVFYNHLLDSKTTTLGEFFDDQMRPHAEKGQLVEAGHQSEWVWLLQRYKEVSNSADPRLNKTMAALFTWVASKGFDQSYGGIFNAQTRDGTPIDTNKRIWPNLETLRAASIMRNVKGFEESAEDVVKRSADLLQSKYIGQDGFWTEILNRDLTANTDYRPGTTPYHIFPVLREANTYIANSKLAVA